MSNIITSIVHSYELIKSTKTTRHYQLLECRGGKQSLTDMIRVSINRNFNKSTSSKYLMHERTKPNKWNDTITTGLNFTDKRFVYSGDIRGLDGRKRDKAIFVFGKDDSLRITIILDYYRY